MYFENMSKPLVWCANDRISKRWLQPSCHSISFHIHVKLCYNISCLSRQFQNDPKCAVSKFWHKWLQVTAMGLLFSVLSRVKTAQMTGLGKGCTDPTRRWRFTIQQPLWFLCPMDLELKLLPKWQCCHPVSNLPGFFSLSSPKDPTHCNVAGPQLESCWGKPEVGKPTVFQRIYSNPKDLPHSGANNTHRRLFINSHPAMRDCIPPAGHRDLMRKSTFLVCDVSIRNFLPPRSQDVPCEMSVSFRAPKFSHGFSPFLCSQCSHLLAKGLKACSPLGPRLQCLTSFFFVDGRSFRGIQKIMDQYGSSIVYYKYQEKTNSNSLAGHLNKFIPMLSPLL